MTRRPQALQPNPVQDSMPYLVDDVLASLGDAVILTDAAGRIMRVNQAAEQLLHLGAAQLVEREITAILAENPRLVKMVLRTLRLGHSQSSGEERLRSPIDNVDVPIRVSCSPIQSESGGIRGSALVIQDLSYQRKLEDEARRNETLARLGSLVAGLAHEIKNPLGGIRGAAQLLARRVAADAQAKAHTEIIVREVDRLADLVEQLLTFGAPRRPERQHLNVHRVLHEVLSILGPEIDKRSIVVRMEIDPSLPDVVGDQAQLLQVFINLVKNALEVMPGGGQLVLSTRIETDFHIVRRAMQDEIARGEGGAPSHGQFVRVGVGDSGPGFPLDLGERVFEPFVTTKARGSGLGLAICERIVAAHGGDIRAENRREGGALVTVNLPVAIA